MGKIAYRLYKISTPSAIIVALPMLLLVAWYAWSTFAQLDRYRRATGADIQFDAELFELALYDTLRQDIRRLLLEDQRPGSRLPLYELSLAPAELDDLNGQPFREGEASYVKGWLRKDGEMHKVGVRYRGNKHWHWLREQKSLKIRVSRGDLIDGARIFNLINGVTPFGMEEQIVLDVARESGLLTPEYHPAWLRLNNTDMGVYRYAAQPTEGLLRRARRMPGSIFSGNGTSVRADGVGALFFGTAGWKQVARRTGQDNNQSSFAELERLLRAVGASHADFASFAQLELDLAKMALFDALDVVFGGDQHDYMSNHKLYFDPYKGRFEPIAWNFRGFKHRRVFNLVENPLLLRLKMTPGYLGARDAHVYRLLLGLASVPAMRARIDAAFTALATDQKADAYWDAYKLLPDVTRFHRFMVRPMSQDRWLLSARAELNQYAQRSRYLLDALEGGGLRVAATATTANRMTLDLTATDHSGALLTNLHVSAPECRGDVRVIADTNLSGAHDQGDQEVARGSLGADLRLHGFNHVQPGVELIPRQVSEKRGAVTAHRTARLYRYFVESDHCGLQAGALTLSNTVTGATSRLPFEVRRGQPPVLPSLPRPEVIPQMKPGEQSPHPWRFEAPARPRLITLGPGTVAIEETRIFDEHHTVRIVANTKLLVAKGASLIFRGRLVVQGELGAHVEIAPLDPKSPWGGLALQGAGSKRSELRHMLIWGGTKPDYLAIDYPGMVNIHDTADITLESVEILGLAGGVDSLRATYVDGLKLYEVVIKAAASDAIDLEYVTGEIRGARVVSPGDECLDLMGTTLLLTDSALIGCANSAISAGEETDVTAHGLLIADSKIGVLSKNASRVRITKSLIYRSGLALRTRRRDVHHGGESSIGAQDLYVVACDKVRKRGRNTRLDAGNVRDSLPESEALRHLLTSVLQIDGWAELDGQLARMAGL